MTRTATESSDAAESAFRAKASVSPTMRSAHLTYPRFSVAAFDHKAEPRHIAVRVRYFMGP